MNNLDLHLSHQPQGTTDLNGTSLLVVLLPQRQRGTGDLPCSTGKSTLPTGPRQDQRAVPGIYHCQFLTQVSATATALQLVILPF